MTTLLRSFITCLCLALASPVLADREVHVIAVGQEHQTDDYYARPEARVLVDRPGHDIGLVLLDRGAVHWKIQTTAGTTVTEIVLGGPRADTSKVSLSGIRVVGVQAPSLPLVFNPWGRDFRTLIDALPAMMGTDRIHSFQGKHKATATAVTVDHVDRTTPGLAQNYLSDQLSTAADLPAKLRRWIADGGDLTAFTVAFAEDGIRLTGPVGTQWFPVSADVPDVVLPVGGVYDAGTQLIYCYTYGAEGFLYSVDVQTGAWAVVSSLNGYDAAGLLYDPDSRQLVATGAFSRPGEIEVYGLDGHRASTFVPTKDFPGLTDLFDYGNEHGPPLTPHVYSDGWLLVQARASQSTNPNVTGFRTYAVQIDTGEVRLLSFGND